MKPTRNPLLFFLGNGLIIVSLLLSLYIYYPLIILYLAPPQIEKITHAKGSFITIPKIHAQAPIVLNVDPWNIDEYREKLTHGVAHAKGSAQPGDSGTSFLFAHSSDLPWNITRDNTAFFRLSELTIGDKIIITKNTKEITYTVFAKREVSPTEVQYLEKDDKDQLILQTCTPIGTDWNRLLIFAKPMEITQ